MEKCQKHGVKMVIREMAIGWGNESKLVCPECEKEARASVNRVVFSTGKAGWQ